MNSIKVDATTMQVARSTTVESTSTYTLTFLLSQRAAIVDQQIRDNAQREAELAEVDALIAEAQKLGLVESTSVDAGGVIP
jgi:hypothetical protein